MKGTFPRIAKRQFAADPSSPMPQARAASTAADTQAAWRVKREIAIRRSGSASSSNPWSVDGSACRTFAVWMRCTASRSAAASRYRSAATISSSAESSAA